MQKKTDVQKGVVKKSETNRRHVTRKPLSTDITQSIVFTPDKRIAEAFNLFLVSGINEILKLPPDVVNSKRKTSIDFDTWKESTEGKFHLMLMTRYVLTTPAVNANEASRIQRRLQSQGKDSRGRPREVSAEYWNVTTRRQLKVYLMNLMIAKSLGFDTKHWEPPVTIDPKPVWTTPIDSYDSMLRFEEWSKIRLPRQAWLAYTTTERRELSRCYPSAPTEPSGGIKLDLYRIYRIDVELFEETINKAA